MYRSPSDSREESDPETKKTGSAGDEDEDEDVEQDTNSLRLLSVDTSSSSSSGVALSRVPAINLVEETRGGKERCCPEYGLSACLIVLFFVAFGAISIYLFVSMREEAQPDEPLSSSAHSLVLGILGDFGRRGNPNQLVCARGLGIACQRYNCSFLVSTGDNFYPGGVLSVESDDFDLSFSNVYTYKSLQKPWYLVLGNHDFGNPDAQIAYTKHGKDKRWNMPDRYFIKRFPLPGTNRSISLIFFDSSPFVTGYKLRTYMNQTALDALDKPVFMDFLRSSILHARNRGDWVLTVAHHPVYSAAPDMTSHDIQSAFLPVFLPNRVHVHLSGHNHNLQFLRVPNSNLHVIVSGAGSDVDQTISPGFPGLEWYHQVSSGYSLLSANATHIVVRFGDQDGVVRYEHSIPYDLS